MGTDVEETVTTKAPGRDPRDMAALRAQMAARRNPGATGGNWSADRETGRATTAQSAAVHRERDVDATPARPGPAPERCAALLQENTNATVQQASRIGCDLGR